jgi:membrane fusion protein, multidrug efflux system
VVTAGVHTLTPGQKVKLYEPPAPQTGAAPAAAQARAAAVAASAAAAASR